MGEKQAKTVSYNVSYENVKSWYRPYVETKNDKGMPIKIGEKFELRPAYIQPYPGKANKKSFGKKEYRKFADSDKPKIEQVKSAKKSRTTKPVTL